jgi:hypothetical protein
MGRNQSRFSPFQKDFKTSIFSFFFFFSPSCRNFVLACPKEIYRVLSLKQLRDPGDDADGGSSTIKPGNKIRSLPVDASVDSEEVRRNCCTN